MFICQPSKSACGRYHFGMHSKRVYGQQRFCGELQRCVRIQDFCWSQGKTTYNSFRKLDAETISSWSYDMEGHAKKCVERYFELVNKATRIFQSRNAMHG